MTWAGAPGPPCGEPSEGGVSAHPSGQRERCRPSLPASKGLKPGTPPVSGSRGSSGPPLLPIPPQRPPMTSGSSSGTSGRPTTTTNSRPGDALGPGWAVEGGLPGGADTCVHGLTSPSYLLAASCSHLIPPLPPCASAQSPPAQTPICWLAARVAAAAGMCGWTSLRKGGEGG